jgi:hypothetical protein
MVVKKQLARETSKFPHCLENRLTDGGEDVSLTLLSPFTPSKNPGNHFCYRLSRRVDPRAIGRLKGLGQLKNPMTSLRTETATVRNMGCRKGKEQKKQEAKIESAEMKF